MTFSLLSLFTSRACSPENYQTKVGNTSSALKVGIRLAFYFKTHNETEDVFCFLNWISCVWTFINPFFQGSKNSQYRCFDSQYQCVFSVFSTRHGTYLRPKNGVPCGGLAGDLYFPQELEEAFRELDKDGSGEIDFPEYLYLGGGKNHMMLRGDFWIFGNGK